MKFIDKIKESKKIAEIEKYIRLLRRERLEQYKTEAENNGTAVSPVILEKTVLVGDDAVNYRKKQQENCERLQRILTYAQKEKNFEVANKVIELILAYGKIKPSSQNPYEDRVQLQMPEAITDKVIKMDKKLDEFYEKLKQEMANSIDKVIETIDR